jgi:transposase InsO family protein
LCDEPAAENLLDQVFTAALPDRLWAADTTFIPTQQGWLFLAVVIDLYSRKVVGWAMSGSNNSQLVCDALTMAIKQRHPKPGLIHHSDQGIQYACVAYRAILKTYDMIPSMSRKGNCHDNAVVESFFSNLKNELIYHQQFKTRQEAKASIFDYIELFYNRRRLHQTLGYTTPEQYEKLMHAA